jgi:hypothetical protein
MFGKVRTGPTTLDKLRVLHQWGPFTLQYTSAGDSSCSAAVPRFWTVVKVCMWG